MTREEHLAFCKKCTNRQFDPQQGIICSITNEKADFEDTCPNFNLDEHVKEERHEPKGEIANHDLVKQLSGDSKERFREHQDFGYAIIGGLLISVLSAIIWAAITVTTEYQIGFMAIGVGFLVGYGVRFFGAGVDGKFGVLGAVLALFGCLLGNFFAQIGFLAHSESIGYLQALQLFDYAYLPQIYTETFSPYDILFYGIAIGEGYKFAFRSISSDDLSQMDNPEFVATPPGYQIRKPAAIAAFVLFALLLFKFNQGADGQIIYKFEDGSKQATGALVDGKEDGAWTYWYQNGKIQAEVYYTDGVPDGPWLIYYESGQKLSEGDFIKGFKNGLWVNYHPTGTVSDSGNYVNDRETGLWATHFINGQVGQTGSFKRGYQEGLWSFYHENGERRAEGMMKDGSNTGLWKYWRETGEPESELNFLADDAIETINHWNLEGQQVVNNGIGTYQEFYVSGQLYVKGEIRNKQKVGRWITYHLTGDKFEEGDYSGGKYQMANSWGPANKAGVKNGNGTYERYSEDMLTLLETGEIVDGKRNGLWKVFYEISGNLQMEMNYVNGEIQGAQTYYFDTGGVMQEGNMSGTKRMDQWKWYFETGELETSVNYIDGKKNGTQLFLDEAGNETKQEIYENGVFISEVILR